MAIAPEPPIEKLRIPFVRKARLGHAGGSEDAFVVDIGLRGVFVERAQPLAVGTEVDLEMLLPGNDIPMRAQCRVAWTHKAEAGALQTKSLPSGIGLELVDATTANLEHIRGLLEAYLQQNPETRRFLRHWPEEAVRNDDPLADDQGA
jgi:Tfp pilus assembly protein PilZ